VTKLSECLLIVDGLAHDRFLRINGTDYDYQEGAGLVTLKKRGGKPHEEYWILDGHCNCPSRRFRPRCKHELAAEALKLGWGEHNYAAL
jgi:hypothetical protein